MASGLVQMHDLQQPLHQQQQLQAHMHRAPSGVFVPIGPHLFNPGDVQMMGEVRGSPDDPCPEIWAQVFTGTPNTNSQRATSSIVCTPPHRDINSAASQRSYQHQPYTHEEQAYTPDLGHPTTEGENIPMYGSSSSRSPSREGGQHLLPEIPECIKMKMTEAQNEGFDRKKERPDVKEVLRSMKELKTYEKACDFMLSKIVNREVCTTLWWKLCYELAELHKKVHLPQARIWLSVVVGLAPRGAVGWMELAKIEEDLNQISMAKALFRQGLRMCVGTEKCVLTMKAIKLLEAFPSPGSGRLIRKLVGDAVRDTLSERSWKVLLEGTLYEARQGGDKIAEKMFECLMEAIPRQGTVYLEAARFYEKNGDYTKAMQIVRKGLDVNPKFGPLVFNGVRLLEKQARVAYHAQSRKRGLSLRDGSVADKLFYLAETQEREHADINLGPIHDFRKEVKDFMCAELIWKLHFEVAQAEERAAQYENSRHSFSLAFNSCLPNLKWKVLVGGARMELAIGSRDVAQRTLHSAYAILNPDQQKTMSIVKLELARFYEYIGDLVSARETLREAQLTDWRAYLEQVSLELRSGEGVGCALDVAREGVRRHRSSARLWAAVIQLTNEVGKDKGGNQAAGVEFDDSKKYVNKAGEVWCEGARLHMDPLQPKLFDLEKAEEYLQNAMRYTPQYGDSFLEMAKLCILKHGGADENWIDPLYALLAVAEPNYGPLWQSCKHSPLMTSQEILTLAITQIKTELHTFSEFFQLPFSKKLPVSDFHPWLFTTALPSVNYQLRYLGELSEATRKRVIFGCEPITS